MPCKSTETLPSAFISYQEARGRLRAKSQSRGFWLPKGKGKGSKGKNKSKGGGTFVKEKIHKTLGERIASSECRKCGQRGHWKWECPNKAKGEEAFIVAAGQREMEVTDHLPENTEAFDIASFYGQEFSDLLGNEVTIGSGSQDQREQYEYAFY